MGVKRKIEAGREAGDLGERCNIWAHGTIFGHEAQVWARGERFGEEGAKIGHKVQDLEARRNIWADIWARSANLGARRKNWSRRRKNWAQGARFGGKAQYLGVKRKI